MTKGLSTTEKGWAGLGALLLILTTLCGSAATTKRVLMLFREASHVPATRMIEQAVRDQLGDADAGRIEFYTEYLDVNRFADASHYRLFRDYLREKYAERRPDVLVMVLTPSFDLAGVRPGELIPGVPVVFIAVNTSELPGLSLGTNVTGIVARPDYRGTLEIIFRLQPDTRRVVVIGGIGSSERMMPVDQIKEAVQAFAGRAQFELWTNQPMSELRSAVASLPARTVVLYSWIFRDVEDHAFVPAKALELLVEKASVPTYVWTDSQLGSGAIGGAVVSYDALGAWAGNTARRILDGAPAATPSIVVLTNGTPLFDWRALQRWGIHEARLPPGSVIRFRQPSFWELYRWRIVGVAVFCCLQTALIVGLLVNRARRREAEAAATLIAQLSSKFINLPSGEVDLAIESAQRRVCECSGSDLSALWQWSSETPRIMTVTHLYSPPGGPTRPDRMDARESFPWTLEKMRLGRTLTLNTEDMPPEAARDQESRRHYGIKSSLVIPLSAGGQPMMGVLTFDTLRAERTWSPEIIERLTLIAQVFVNALERKQAEEALRQSCAEIKRLKDRLQAESDYLKAEIKFTQAHGEIIGRSDAIGRVLRQVEQVAPTDSSVLICGETGTGKELIAQAIHRLSHRTSHLLMKVNCAALPSALVESELFGREKGAFTGALTRQVGRFEVADGSTIFLDEIGELSLEVQAKLLRVLQEGCFERLGSPKTIQVNVRVIAATNRDLAEEVRKSRFREDLYYRLNVFPIRVPPLRERTEDIPLLVWAFLEEFSSRMGKKITQVSRQTMETLQRQAWPGNVRELRNVIEHAAIVTSGNTLRVPLLELAALPAQPPQTLADSERDHILKALEQTGWRIKGPKGAAALLGLNPSTLYSRMLKLNIPHRRQKEHSAD